VRTSGTRCATKCQPAQDLGERGQAALRALIVPAPRRKGRDDVTRGPQRALSEVRAALRRPNSRGLGAQRLLELDLGALLAVLVSNLAEPAAVLDAASPVGSCKTPSSETFR
jgi:hypothetical protein